MNFDNSYARLGDTFSAAQGPVPVKAPGAIRVNDALAETLGIDSAWLHSSEAIDVFAGNRLPDGAEPISSAYAGHQFGGWNPQLGDGRAVLLGELLNKESQRFDLQLKGSGRTPWSRSGDGRSPLGPVIREYILSEAMHALHVPTSRSLAAVTTGEAVYRETSEPGAILCRVASSHIRVGTFQYLAARQLHDALGTLVQHVIARHYPQCAEAENPPLALLNSVIDAQAKLVARWQSLGFIHGVMNTDNTLISGETIDYGPCAFMDSFDPDKVFSSIDSGGRYAYRNQPAITHWNMAQLAQCLLGLINKDEAKSVELAQASLDRFPERYAQCYRNEMAPKLGLSSFDKSDDALIEGFTDSLAERQLDFTLAFRSLGEMISADTPSPRKSALGEVSSDLDSAWLSTWRLRLEKEQSSALEQAALMNANNPVLIPRNHQVQAAIDAAYDGHYEVFNQLTEALTTPYELGNEGDVERLASSPDSNLSSNLSYRLELAKPPQSHELVKRTFCGT